MFRLAIAWFIVSAVCAAQAEEPHAIEVKSVRIRLSETNPKITSVGKLKWRGTLQLTSQEKAFGGLSGLVVSADGSRFVAISDEAHWVTGELLYDKGRLNGVTHATITPMLDLSGQPMSGKQGDAEGLVAAMPNDVSGSMYVSFEGQHRIWLYSSLRDGQRTVQRDIPLPAAALAQPRNGGIEAVTRVDGALLALSEELRTAEGNVQGWLIPLADSNTTTRDISVKRDPPFVITDVQVLPGGDVVTLERSFSLFTGMGMQLRRISKQQLAAGGVVDGEVLAKLDMSYGIDNMEGLSVRSGEHGETLIYLISDDNFAHGLQRTLLMMFELSE